MSQFCAEHGSILLLVVQFQALKEILVASLLLVFFALAEDGQEFVDFHLLLALLLRAAQLLDGGIRWVQVQCTKDVAKVNGVDDVGAFVVVDGEGEFCPFFEKKRERNKRTVFQVSFSGSQISRKYAATVADILANAFVGNQAIVSR